MSDESRQKLGVDIEITSNPAEAEKAGKALDKFVDKAKEENKTSDDGGKLTNELSDKTKAYIKSLEGATEQGEKFHLTHRNIRQLTRDLIKNMPELGEVLSELTNPMLGLTFAIGAVVSKMIEYETQMKEMEERPGPDWEADTKKLEDLRQGYEEAALSANKFMREMDELAHKQRTPQEQTDQRIAQLKELASSEEELLNKQRERDEAGIDAAEKLGLLSHAQAVAAKLNLDESYNPDIS